MRARMRLRGQHMQRVDKPYARMHVCMYVCMCACVCLFTYVVCIHKLIYIYI